MTAKHMISQNTHKSYHLVKSVNVFEKEKKIVSLFFKANTKLRKKTFSCESTAEPASSGKGSFFNQDEWLREIEEHERIRVKSSWLK